MGAAEERFLSIISGEARGVGPALSRAALGCLEPVYATLMRVRNLSFDRGWKETHALPRPTISVGNLTTGGTGKTPVVRWLAERLRDAGRHPAILMRGYAMSAGGISDEQLMLEEQLHRRAARRIIVHADPDRVAGAKHVVKHDPATDVFVLDDAFQHRRAKRDFDLVLVNAAEPFGYGHVLPRGLLREPLSSVRRADAVVITRSDQVSVEQLVMIEQTIRRYHAQVPVYRARHALVSLLAGNETAGVEVLRERPFFAFAGIGNPRSLSAQLELFGQCVGQRWFGDHHAYTSADLAALREEAKAAGAELLVTTEKDWPKLKRLPEANGSPPIARLGMAVRFSDDDEARLFEQIQQRIEAAAAAAPAVPSDA